ncbi:MAG: helix-turn-helix transcriptional regulator [Actinoplanes sp.]
MTGLSTRHRQILALVSEGVPDKGIARELGIGVRTVRSHLDEVCFRLGARNRSQAVAQGFRKGLLS